MAWARPNYSRSDVNKAGRSLAGLDGIERASDDGLVVINNWRSAHSYPLNVFQMQLRNRSRRVCEAPLVAQRLKRLQSIHAKLQRFPGMRLDRMQDIGGCRAVVATPNELENLASLYRVSQAKNPRNRQELVGIDDYVRAPQSSGYRGIHFKYRYRSSASDYEVYNGLRIEVQLRTRLQHCWATAVETIGTFLAQPLKSSQGPDSWLRFFALMGSYFAVQESGPWVPDTPATGKELLDEIRECAIRLDVSSKLESYTATVDQAENVARGAQRSLFDDSERGHYYLLEQDPSSGRTRISAFSKAQFGEANEAYLAAEQRLAGIPGAESVLVSVDSIRALKRAYPNYFLDTRRFLSHVRSILLPRRHASTLTQRTWPLRDRP